LNYDKWRDGPFEDGSHTARWHITNRHIEQLPQYVGNTSVYEFFGRPDIQNGSVGQKQAAVGQLNALTFMLAKGVKQANGNFAYTFDFTIFDTVTRWGGIKNAVGVSGLAIVCR
jgi:hypothetical protein